MLTTEWNWDEALEVRFNEGWEGGLEKGIEEGWEKGREEIARNALSRGMSPEAVSEIAGLDIETIRRLAGL
jgi:predicted transposase YdaD